MARLRLGTRGSQLARWQAEHIAAKLRSRGHEVEIQIIKTTGDSVAKMPLPKAAGSTKAIFIKEIEEALAEGSIGLAVHSLKDLPAEAPAEFEIAAVSERAEPRDAFVSQSVLRLSDLPRGASVATSSLRRQAQLKALRADLKIVPVRGNVDSRLRRLQAGEFDAIILAAAGLLRLQRVELLRELISPEIMCPAAGQGALAIEIRAGEAELRRQIEFLNHAETSRATHCERALLKKLGGGCQVPIGALATIVDGGLQLTAVVARPDGSEVLRAIQRGKDAAELGAAVGEELLQKGAARILREATVPGGMAAVPQQP